MDIEFIEMEHRENVLQLMQVCGLDLNQAYQLYMNSGNNLQAAIQKQLAGHSQNFGMQNIPMPKIEQNYGYQQPRGPMAQGFGDHDDQYQKYRNFQNAGINFLQKYQIKRSQPGIRGWSNTIVISVPKIFKSAPQNSFKKSLQTLIEKPCKVQFGNGSLSQNFEQIWKSKFPLVVHLQDFKSQNKKIITELYTDDYLSFQVLNNQFRNYGIDVNSYEIQKDLKTLINYQRAPCLLVFRVNIVDQIKLLETISLNQVNSIDQIRKKLKFVKSNCIQIQMEELHLEKRFKAELNGDFFYQKPVSIAEKRKIAQDRAIRKKQEQQFMASMKIQEQKKVQQIAEEQKKQAQKPKFNVKQHREQIRKRLTIYQQGMIIKLRLPSGETSILTVSPRQKVEYLFDYVQCQERDMGFQRDDLRNMEIMRPYDRLNLSEHKNKTLGQVFQDSESESLVVAEKDS